MGSSLRWNSTTTTHEVDVLNHRILTCGFKQRFQLNRISLTRLTLPQNPLLEYLTCKWSWHVMTTLPGFFISAQALESSRHQNYAMWSPQWCGHIGQEGNLSFFAAYAPEGRYTLMEQPHTQTRGVVAPSWSKFWCMTYPLWSRHI